MAKNERHALKGHKHFVLSDEWAEPYTLDELAVDRKKVAEISSWLSAHRHQCGILLLTGPTGSGKTALVKCLARCLNFEIREWITPLDRDYQNGSETGVFQNQAEKFEDFLYSCSRYADLFVKSSSTASLLLVEDYPNIFLMKPEVFHEVLGRYCGTARAPVVFICSDVAEKELKIQQDLFPINIQMKLGLTHVSLNPITKTSMLKALKRMSALLQTLSSGYKPPSQDLFAEIIESASGDVRFAMLSLQVKPQEDVAAMFDLAGKKGIGKKPVPSKKLTQEEEVVSACCKDDRVGMLHSVGRVLYPKWQKAGEKHLKSAVKRKRKTEEQQEKLDASVPSAEWINDPNTIADSYLSAAPSFLLLVQENYLKTFSTIESVAGAALCLSDADMLMTSEGVETSHGICFNVAVRGVMVHNKFPNRAFTSVRGSKHWDMLKTQTEISKLTATLFPQYPISHTVLMTDIIPYMSFNGINLSSDQNKFVQKVASMEPLSQFCETFRSYKQSGTEQKTERASFVLGVSKSAAVQADELHISEDDSDEEHDEGAANLTMLQAAMDEDFEMDEGAENLSLLENAINEEEGNELDYLALLNDSDDDDILLSQI